MGEGRECVQYLRLWAILTQKAQRVYPGTCELLPFTLVSSGGERQRSSYLTFTIDSWWPLLLNNMVRKTFYRVHRNPHRSVAIPSTSSPWWVN